LTDAGYDVWLGNVRGNRFSRNHTHLTPEDPSFWRWSWDQIAKYDFPAQVSTVVKVSGQERLVVVGYSQGTMVTLAALSNQPQLARHIAGAALLAPVAFTGHMASPPFTWSVRLRLDLWAAAKGWGSWGAWNAEAAGHHAHYCARWAWVCRLFFTAICGGNPAPGGNIAASSVPLLASHLPAGTSVHNMGHWSQVRGEQCGSQKRLQQLSCTPLRYHTVDTLVTVDCRCLPTGRGMRACKQTCKHTSVSAAALRHATCPCAAQVQAFGSTFLLLLQYLWPTVCPLPPVLRLVSRRRLTTPTPPCCCRGCCRPSDGGVISSSC
jgi:hypothetical protein